MSISLRVPLSYPASASGPLHPLAFELAERRPAPRAALHDAWIELLDGPRTPMPAAWMGELPFVASQTLARRLDSRIRDLLGWLGPRLARQAERGWPLAPAADVLSADLAIVEAPEREEGWDLRWVEVQAFTSLVTTMYTLHRAASLVWPELETLPFWGWRDVDDWRSAAKAWMAPAPGSILLEFAPDTQPTRFDFDAVTRWFGVPLVQPHELRACGSQLECRDPVRGWRPVPHVANRLVLHETARPEELEELLASVAVGWNSHPAWFYRVDKGVMPDLPLPADERCVRADRWRELGRPAEDLVAKALHSYAGRGVRFKLDASALDGLADAKNWIVQPRYRSLPLMNAADGAPLYGEIRCVVALGESPWIVARIARLSRGTMASAGRWSGAAGEGTVPVHAPPEMA